MENFRTIYDVCYDVLFVVTNNITNIYYEDNNRILLELYAFLTTDNTQFERVFSDITYFKFDDDKHFYKQIMMLIIVSSSYYLALYQHDHDISADINLEIIDDLEELSSCDIIKMFYDLDNNPSIVDYMRDYMDFSSKNYILKNGCLDSIFKNKKLKQLLKLNPFEVFNYLNYIDLDSLLMTEKYIQDFIDLYDASLCAAKDDVSEIFEDIDSEDQSLFYEHLIEIFKEKIREHFNNDEEHINEFFSYIFSNIYETLTVMIKKDKVPSKKYQSLLKLFSSCNYHSEELYMAFMQNNDIAFMLIDFFIDTNDDIYEVDLITKRDDYMEVGNVEILRDLNPYYDEENIVFEQIKQKTKEYPN